MSDFKSMSTRVLQKIHQQNNIIIKGKNRYNNKKISKSLQRQQVELIVENYREIMQKSLLNDLNNILTTLCLGERNESTETITYTGPELVNVKKIQVDNFKNFSNENMRSALLDVEKKNEIYFSYLTKEIDEKKIKKQSLNQIQALQKALQIQIFDQNNQEINDISNLKQNDQFINIQEVPKSHISYFPKVSFALIKGRTWQYYMQKLQIIIGRSIVNNTEGKKNNAYWQVDLEVGDSKRISRQHAI
ncbi:hypothetical protein IMG5_083860 [Ichthyophthirius multifiliis]|uniref:FHA domain-containing protein n=1 Tax=Ichthyophthirius multifiliis TaxID=5932 RepID=G0QQU1_ICHMU|nr:hypothetical protein IMG5_083860 [Ichthyophthirius multifiliis]EGR32417.1 hypothetical protein IMG5_083860 [Ichthyophthirius multifiliis]|eukprot:XP_004036403.1 hypothetical protein IMG5_083860 [Ichthyophthirius multifiliis]